MALPPYLTTIVLPRRDEAASAMVNAASVNVSSSLPSLSDEESYSIVDVFEDDDDDVFLFPIEDVWRKQLGVKPIALLMKRNPIKAVNLMMAEQNLTWLYFCCFSFSFPLNNAGELLILMYCIVD